MWGVQQIKESGELNLERDAEEPGARIIHGHSGTDDDARKDFREKIPASRYGSCTRRT